MKTYSQHLDSIAPKTAAKCLQASAIFPVIEADGIHTRILFLNYWKIKRDIHTINVAIALRDDTGKHIATLRYVIEKPKAYAFEVRHLLSRFLQQQFYGSLEVTFSAEENLVFPFPAVVVDYYNATFHSFVHTAQRIYNDLHDQQKNHRDIAIEGGFSLYTNPFITFINGSIATKEKQCLLTLFNAHNEAKAIPYTLAAMQPYALVKIDLNSIIDGKKFLCDMPGTCNIAIPDPNIFPRLIAGNAIENGISITHTYYDCSEKDGCYWSYDPQKYSPATLMLPICPYETGFTHIYLYPLLPDTKLMLSVSLFDERGSLIEDSAHTIEWSKTQNFKRIDTKELFASTIPSNSSLLFTAIPADNTHLPDRIKIGLDWGMSNKGLPCNICTNFLLANPSFDEKPSIFRWLPIITDSNTEYCFTIHNASPKKAYSQTANCKLTFYREKDCESLCETISIQPYGSLFFYPDAKLKNFLKNTTGWCTIQSDNPYITAFYFTRNSNGIIGGDHSF